MAWLPDEQYEFIKDSMDKKNIARSARSTRTHCGKSGAVKFPSDFKTKKELNAMNGEVKSYRMNDPMTWAEFKEMPNDLKVNYIKALREKYNVSDKYIAEMMGVHVRTLQLVLADLKCACGKGMYGGNRKWPKEAFLAWAHGADPEAVSENEDMVVEEMTFEDLGASESVVEDVTTCATDIELPESIEETECCNLGSTERICASPVTGSLCFECDADQALNMLATILGTHKVELNVDWIIRD